MGHFYSDKEYVYCNDDYMEVYIELSDFDETKKYAVDYSSYIEVLGVLHVGLFENGKFKEFRVLNHPYRIKMYAYDTVTRTIEFPRYGSVPCRVLSYTKGAILMDAAIIQDAQNALTYLDMVLGGKTPMGVPYNKSITLWNKNQNTNKAKFAVREEVKEMILALSYRNPKDMSQQFAQIYGSDLSVSPFDYVIVDSRKICQYASTFSGITFEDIDTMISTSINRARKKTKESFSPVEEVIKM